MIVVSIGRYHLYFFSFFVVLAFAWFMQHNEHHNTPFCYHSTILQYLPPPLSHQGSITALKLKEAVKASALQSIYSISHQSGAQTLNTTHKPRDKNGGERTETAQMNQFDTQ
eukprot:110216_1